MKRSFRFIPLLVIALTLIPCCTDFRDEEQQIGFQLNLEELDLSSIGAIRSVTVTSGSEWDVVSMPSWISLRSIRSSSSSFYEWEVYFFVEENKEYDREGGIVFESLIGTTTLFVLQNGDKGVRP